MPTLLSQVGTDNTSVQMKSIFMVPEEEKYPLKKIKCRDISAKYYALLAYNKAWRKNWNESLAAPTITMPKIEFDFHLPATIGSWADYEMREC